MTPLILGIVAAGLYGIEKLDRKMEPDPKVKRALLQAGLACGGLIRWILGPEQTAQRVLLALVMGCLLLGCVTDVMTCQVYNFVWWLGGAAAAVLLWKRLWTAGGAGMWILAELAAFWAIQLGVFSRLYGKADCYGFCVCAAAAAGLGMNLREMALHTAFAFCLLLPVQCINRNVTKTGKLKKPVPFLPYLTAGFGLILIFVKICGETVVPQL